MGAEEDRKFENYRNFMSRLGSDPELRGRMRADPSGVLEEQGVGLSPATEVRVIEDSAEVRHFVLPPDPNATLSDDSMSAVSGGGPQVGDQGIPASTYSPFADYFDPI